MRMLFLNDLWLGLQVWIWLAIAGVLLLSIILIISLVCRKKKKAKAKIKADEDYRKNNEFLGPKYYTNFEGTFKAENGVRIVVKANHLWIVETTGKTTRMSSVSDLTPTVAGDIVYIVDKDLTTKVVKVGDDYEKITKETVNYQTVTFVSTAQVTLNNVNYNR